jgi:hypothetical protein
MTKHMILGISIGAVPHSMYMLRIAMDLPCRPQRGAPIVVRVARSGLHGLVTVVSPVACLIEMFPTLRLWWNSLRILM